MWLRSGAVGTLHSKDNGNNNDFQYFCFTSRNNASINHIHNHNFIRAFECRLLFLRWTRQLSNHNRRHWQCRRSIHAGMRPSGSLSVSLPTVSRPWVRDRPIFEVMDYSNTSIRDSRIIRSRWKVHNYRAARRQCGVALRTCGWEYKA